jgi:hypothetical protein
MTVSDQYGELTDVTSETFVVQVTDTEAPVFAWEPTAVATSATSMTISWSAFDDWGIEKFIVEFNGETYEVTPDIYSLSIDDLSGRAYTYSVTAVDYAGNRITTGEQSFALFADVSTNLLANGVSQIVAFDADRKATIYVDCSDSENPYWKSVYDWADDSAMSVVGVGRFTGSEVDFDGVLIYNAANHTFGAWTNLTAGNYGWVSLGNAGKDVSVVTLADLDGNGFDDIVVTDANGDLGILKDGKVYEDLADGKVVGVGNFGDGNELIYDTGAAYTFGDAEISKTAAEIAEIAGISGEGSWEFVATGDFAGDGIDDIVLMWTPAVQLTADENQVPLVILNDGKIDDVLVDDNLIDPNGWEVAGVGDYNGDGKDDLLLRELSTGWGGLTYWQGGVATDKVSMDFRVETESHSGSGSFAIIDNKVKK